jgi:DNA-binding NarL/FixJ family response regulator
MPNAPVTEGPGRQFDKERVMQDAEEVWAGHSVGGQTLTRRETEIVRLVSQGLANKVIARELGVREGTVKIHLHSVFRKLRISSRADLILSGIEKSVRMPG